MGNITPVPWLGNVQTVIFPVLGQVLMGLAVDSFGWFDAQVRELTALRLAGAILVCGGVIGASLAKEPKIPTDRKRQVMRTRTRHVWFWRCAGLVIGALMVSQTAVNSHLGFLVESRIYAAFINCCIGTGALILINLVVAIRRRPYSDKGRAPWWIWAGGLFGILFIVGNIITAQLLGTGMSVIILLTGMTVGGILADHFGLFREERKPVNIQEITGIAVMLAGVALFNLA